MVSIAQERAQLAAVGWQLRTREQWGARRAYTDSRPVTEPATRVFVHITITEPSNYSSDDAHARAIEAIGIARFPNTGISYNRLIFQSGTAAEGQPISRRGAHTVNDKELANCRTTGCPGRGASLTAPSFNLNINSRAYVICQNVDNIVTDAQLDALARAIAGDKLAGFVHLNAEIHGHRCVAWKSCPAELMWDRMAQLDALVAHYVRNGLEPVPKPEPGPEVSDMPLLLRGGTSRRRLVLGDRIFGVSQSDWELIAATGVPATGVSNELIDTLDAALVAEGVPADEPQV